MTRNSVGCARKGRRRYQWKAPIVVEIRLKRQIHLPNCLMNVSHQPVDSETSNRAAQSRTATFQYWRPGSSEPAKFLTVGSKNVAVANGPGRLGQACAALVKRAAGKPSRGLRARALSRKSVAVTRCYIRGLGLTLFGSTPSAAAHKLPFNGRRDARRRDRNAALFVSPATGPSQLERWI